MKKQWNLSDYKGYFQKQANGDILVDRDILKKSKELGHKNFWRVMDFIDGRMSFHEIDQLETGMVDVHTMRTQFNKNSKKTYQRIAKRDGEICGKCHTKNKLTLDHIVPLSNGGSNDDDNLQILCARCNQSKGAR